MSDTATFGALIDANYGVHAYCNACRHNAELNLTALADRFGRDHPSMRGDLLKVLRCSKCGSKDLSLTYSPSSTGAL